MSNPTHYDIAIIGAGAAGLSAGFFLSEQARILVLEREPQPAYHSSGRSAAMYIEGYESPIVAELTRQGRNFFHTPPAGFCEHSLLSPSAGLTVAGHGEEAKLDKYLATWSPLCPELTLLNAEQTLEILPVLRPEWLTQSAYDPSWQNIDVHELLSGYQRGIKANQASIPNLLATHCHKYTEGTNAKPTMVHTVRASKPSLGKATAMATTKVAATTYP